MEKCDELVVNGITYVRKDLHAAETLDGMKYCIVRTESAGVFAGYIESRNGQEVVIRKARRLWYWDGAASLSQLAMSGTSKPDKCKFPEEMNRVIVTQAIEIIECTTVGLNSIQGVCVWKA